MQTIDHDTERMMTDTSGHQHQCWEDFAERMVEESGLEIAGRHDDMIKGMTIWEHYTVRVLAARTDKECRCETEPEEDGTFEEE